MMQLRNSFPGTHSGFPSSLPKRQRPQNCKPRRDKCTSISPPDKYLSKPCMYIHPSRPSSLSVCIVCEAVETPTFEILDGNCLRDLFWFVLQPNVQGMLRFLIYSLVIRTFANVYQSHKLTFPYLWDIWFFNMELSSQNCAQYFSKYLFDVVLRPSQDVLCVDWTLSSLDLDLSLQLKSN